jgi:hypothetical protein
MISINNEANLNADVQLFAHSGCEGTMHKLNLFESIPDFAASNGMCNFRNSFHYKNTTAGKPVTNNIIEVKDSVVHHTDRAGAETLQDLQILKTLPHPCDRTYSYTNYDVCNGPATRRDSTGGVDVPAKQLTVTQTWLQKDGHWHARFCDMRPNYPWSFLNPYSPVSGTLHSATSDVRRCSEYNLCPSVHFQVSGRTVDTRRVRTYVRGVDAEYGVQSESTQPIREYCGLDAQRCLGMGYLLGIDCNEIEREESQLCVVDRLVLPLVSIVFGNADNKELPNELVKLQHHCARAFTLSFKGKQHLDLFLDAHYYLTRPYEWDNDATRRKVFEYANSLLWLVFGMTEEKESAGRVSDGRGVETVEHYIEHSHCAIY